MKYTLRKADTDTEEVFVTREMRVDYIYVDELDVGERKRPLDSEKVGALAESMRVVGLLNPITVTLNKDEVPLELVAGRHRLEAAKQLGWEQIPAVFIKTDEVHRELLEIDENLIRHNLTPTQEADHLARRKELWATINGMGPDLETELRYKRPKPKKVGQVGSVSGGRGNKGFAAETAAATGQSKRSINRALQRAQAVAPEVMAEIEGTSLDKGANLDALAKMEPEEQKRAVAEAKATGKPVGPRLVVDTTVAPPTPPTTKKAQKEVEGFGARVFGLAEACRSARKAGIPDGLPKADAKNLFHELVGAHTALGKLLRALEEMI